MSDARTMTLDELFEDIGEELLHPHEKRCLAEIRSRFDALEAQLKTATDGLATAANTVRKIQEMMR